MKTLHQLLKLINPSLSQTGKRLIYMSPPTPTAAPSAAPAAAPTPGAPEGEPLKPEAAKKMVCALLHGNDAELPEDWSKINSGFIGDLNAAIASDSLPEDVKKWAKTLIDGDTTNPGLKKRYETLMKKPNITKADIDKLKADIKAKTAELEAKLGSGAEKAKLDALEKKHLELSGQVFSEAAVKEYFEQTFFNQFNFEGVDEKVKKQIIDIAEKHLQGAVQAHAHTELGELNSLIAEARALEDPAKLDELKQKVAELEAAFAKFPTTVVDYIAARPQAQISIDAQAYFVSAAITVSTKFENIGGDGAKCQAAKKAQAAKITRLHKALAAGRITPAQLIAESRAIETEIVVGHMQDVVGAALTAAGVEDIEADEKYKAIAYLLRTYGLGKAGDPAETSQRDAIRDLVKWMDESKDPNIKALREQIVFRAEGGADGTRYNLDKTRDEADYYTKMGQSATRMMAEMPNDPYVQANLALLREIADPANSGDPAKWAAYVQGLDAAKRSQLTDPNGPLNVLIAYRRSEDVSGQDDDPNSLRNIAGVIPGLYLETTATGQRHRYGLVASWRAGHPHLGTSRTSARPGIPARTPGTTPAGPETPQEKFTKGKARAKKALEDGIAILQTLPANKPQEVIDLEEDIRGKMVELNQIIEAVDKLDLSTLTPAKLEQIQATLNEKAEALEKKIAELKAKIGTPAAAPTAAPTSAADLQIPFDKVKPGETLEFAGRKFEFDGTHYRNPGSDHPLTRQEVAFLVGKEVPTEAYRKEKLTVSYLQGEPEMRLIYSSRITGHYRLDEAGTSHIVEVEYDIETGERSVKKSLGSPEKLIKREAGGAISQESLAGALADGLDISGLDLSTSDSKLKAFHDLITQTPPNWKGALESLEPTETNLSLIVRSLEKLATNWTIIDRAKLEALKPLLSKIAAAYGLRIDATTLAMFEAINKGKLKEEALLTAIAGNKKITSAALVELIKVPDNAKNPALANKYVKEAFDDSIDFDVNLQALLAFSAGDITKIPAVIDYVISQYDEFKKRGMEEGIKNLFRHALESGNIEDDAKFQKVFEILYPSYPAGVDATTGPKTWARYVKTKGWDNFFDAQFEKILPANPAGVPALVPFIEATLEQNPNFSIGPVSAFNLAAARDIFLPTFKLCTSPRAKGLTQTLIQAISDVDSNFTIDQADRKKRGLELYQQAKSGATPEARIAAIEALLGSAGFDNFNPLADQGKSLAFFETEMQKLLAAANYEAGNFDQVTDPSYLEAEPRKKFIEAYKKVASGQDLDEDEMKYLLTNNIEIGGKALYELAITKNGTDFVMSAAHRLRIFREIGMLQKAKDLVGSIADKAERSLLQATLITTERYKEITDPEKKKEIQNLLTLAYGEITDTTPRSVQLQIFEQLLELSGHPVDAEAGKKILELLDTPGSALNKLAHLSFEAIPAGADAATIAAIKSRNALILQAKKLRYNVEAAQWTIDPTGGLGSARAELLADAYWYMKAAKEGEGLEAEELKQMAVMLQDIIKVTHPLTDGEKTILGELMVAYAVANPGDAAAISYIKANIDPAKLTNQEDRADYYAAIGDSLTAAEQLDVTASGASDKLKEKKKKLLDAALGQVGSDAAKLERIAVEYSEIHTSEAHELAARTYLAINKPLEAAKLLSDPSSPIEEGTLSSILDTYFRGKENFAINIAADRGFYQKAFEIFKANGNSTIKVADLEKVITSTPVTIAILISTIQGRAGAVVVKGTDAELQTFFTTHLSPAAEFTSLDTGDPAAAANIRRIFKS